VKTIWTLAALAACMMSAPAQAGHKEDCDRPDYAQQYAAGFDGQLNSALDNFKAQDTHYRGRLDVMKAALIKAGAWSDTEASVFMVKATVTDEDAKVLEAERRKAAGDFKVQLLSLQGIPVIAGGDKAAEVRATCLLGPGAIGKADALYAAAGRAWALLESKVAAVAREKNVPLP